MLFLVCVTADIVDKVTFLASSNYQQPCKQKEGMNKQNSLKSDIDSCLLLFTSFLDGSLNVGLLRFAVHEYITIQTIYVLSYRF